MTLYFHFMCNTIINLNKRIAEDLMAFIFWLIQTQKKTCGKKTNQSPRTVPLITMNPQALKKTLKKDKEEKARSIKYITFKVCLQVTKSE